MAHYSVFGLGYVGSTILSALSSQGHHVIGVDPNPRKREAVDHGKSPVGEPGLDDGIAAGRAQNLIRVTDDVETALRESTLAFICVGTPSHPDGRIDLGAVAKVTQEIARALPRIPSKVGLVYRSTVIPGTMETTVLPEFERAAPGGEGSRYEVAYHPEFMREGTGLEDYHHPPKIVVGARTPWILDALSATFPAAPLPVFRTDFRTAELVKYVDNAFHATKITFANEIGALAKAFDVDTATLTGIFLSDRKLNISEAYLRPGYAFGGSCLPKDLRALVTYARSKKLSLPLLAGALESNKAQIERVAGVIREKAGSGPVGFIGLTFKDGTDDLRESPYLKLAAEVARGGLPILCHDPDLDYTKLLGANLEYAERELPGLTSLLKPTAAELWKACRVVVTGRGSDFGTEDRVQEFVGRGGWVVDLVSSISLRRWAGRSYWCVV